MLESLIAIISIVAGIIGANLFGFIFKKYSFELVGNSIAGVFGSIFFIKSIGRLGFNPIDIVKTGTINHKLLIINLIISFFGAVIALILLKIIYVKLNNIK
jgi:uncharacterized membrane protein YeaQ/YmgE (transglycosylase-associated protein family)